MYSHGSKFTVRCSSSSSSLSEVEEDWSERMSLRSVLTSPKNCPKKYPDRCPPKPDSSDCYNIQCSEVSLNIASTSETCSDKLMKLELKINKPKQLITGVAEGKRYILPFEHITDNRICEDPVKEPNNQDLFYPMDSELLVRKEPLCGDFSFVDSGGHKSQTVPKVSVEHTGEIGGKSARPPVKKVSRHSSKVASATSLGVSRLPIHCPIAQCQQLVCSGFLGFHLNGDHAQVLRLVCDPEQVHNVLVDPSVNEYGVIHCNAVFYLNDKVRDFGFDEAKNQLPVLLVSTKLTLRDLGSDSEKQPIEQQYMYWFTGITSEQLKTQYTLSIDSCKWQCGFVHPLGKPQNIRDIYHSGNGVVISQAQLERFLRPEDNLLFLSLTLD